MTAFKAPCFIAGLVTSLMATLISLLIAGCTKHEVEKPASEPANVPAGVIPTYQQQALDKAKGTEKVLEDAAEKQRQSIDAHSN